MQTVDIRQVGVVAKGLDGGVDRVGFDERFVSLDVDDEVAVESGGNFGQSIGACQMVWSSSCGRCRRIS